MGWIEQAAPAVGSPVGGDHRTGQTKIQIKTPATAQLEPSTNENPQQKNAHRTIAIRIPRAKHETFQTPQGDRPIRNQTCCERLKISTLASPDKPCAPSQFQPDQLMRSRLRSPWSGS
jgi:hypothetical protein